MIRRPERYPDVASVRRQARRNWERDARSRLSLQERIGESVPWWLISIAMVFFLLSVPHTMAVFNKITPDVGYVAPFGVEFGLLYAAFRRRQIGRLSLQLFVLESLLFITAIVVNGAGSLEAVIRLTRDIQDKSFEVLISEYRYLPIGSQVALLLVPVAALIIPIGTTVAGEGLAALFLERRQAGSLLEEQWQQDRLLVEFEALRDAALSNGITPGRAVRWAEQITGYGRPQLSATDGGGQTDTDTERTFLPSGSPSAKEERGHGSGQGYTKNMSAREAARKHLAEHPDAADLSVRAFADQVGIGKTVAAEVLAEYRTSGTSSPNGHGHYDTTDFED